MKRTPEHEHAERIALEANPFWTKSDRHDGLIDLLVCETCNFDRKLAQSMLGGSDNSADNSDHEAPATDYEDNSDHETPAADGAAKSEEDDIAEAIKRSLIDADKAHKDELNDELAFARAMALSMQ